MDTLIKRSIELPIRAQLFKGNIILIYGARRVGKTTLIDSLVRRDPNPCRFSGFDPVDVHQFEGKNFEHISIRITTTNSKYIIIDDAQKFSYLEEIINFLYTKFGKTKQILVASSCLLSLEFKHTFVFNLYGFSAEEIIYSKNELNNALLFGAYPEVYMCQSDRKLWFLNEIVSIYIYRNLYKNERIQKSGVLEKLLVAIAHELGSPVSLSKIGRYVGLDSKTVLRYIRLLEKHFVIFRHFDFVGYQKSVSRKVTFCKIYFYDLGVRNFILDAFENSFGRSDLQALQENYQILEKKKLVINMEVIGRNSV